MSPSTTPNSSRIYWIDQMRGFTFYLVILAHIRTYPFLNPLISAFHMPVFFMISGFTTNIEKIAQQDIKSFIGTRSRNLLIPYLWLEFFTYPIWAILYKVILATDHPLQLPLKGIFLSQSRIQTATSNPSWFILTLFVAYIYFYIAIKLSKGKTSFLLFIQVIYFVIGWKTVNYHLPWHVNTAFIGATFLCIGYYIRKSILPFIDKSLDKFQGKRKILIASVALIAVTLLDLYVIKLNGKCSMVNGIYQNIFFFYITSVLSALILSLVFKMLPSIKVLTYVGQNTLLYLAIHVFIIRLVEGKYPDIYANYNFGVLLSILIFFGLIPVCYVVNRFSPYVNGKALKEHSLITEIAKYFCIMWCVAIPGVIALRFLSIRLGNTLFVQKPVMLIAIAGTAAILKLLMNRFPGIFFLGKK